jgi:hypothetical protein
VTADECFLVETNAVDEQSAERETDNPSQPWKRKKIPWKVPPKIPWKGISTHSPPPHISIQMKLLRI